MLYENFVYLSLLIKAFFVIWKEDILWNTNIFLRFHVYVGITTKMEKKSERGVKGTKNKRFPLKERTLASSICPPSPSFFLIGAMWTESCWQNILKAGKTKWNEAKSCRSVAYLKSLPQVGKIYCKVDVKENFHHRKKRNHLHRKRNTWILSN